MSIATLTTKGQITIPVAVRQSLGVGTGDRVEFVEVASGRFEVIAVTRPVTALKGMFAGRSKASTLAEMDEAIGHAVADNLAP